MKKILVMDDNDDIRDAIELLLSKNNFEVTKAENGQKGLEKLKTKKFDLILLDVYMPGLSTSEILAEIKKRKLDIPIILMSGSNIDDVKGKLKNGSFEDYKIENFIEKPFDTTELLNLVKKAVK